MPATEKPRIGGLTLDSPFLLAPLAGVTDAPMRRLCREMGAALTYTEMVSAKGLWYGDRNTARLLFLYPEEGPVGFQLFGHEPEVLGWAARELDGRDNALLDLNLGCPVPKVVRNGDGSALLKDPDGVYDAVSAMVRNTKKPVTAKIRIGWDEGSINAVEVAHAVSAAGAAAIAVHGRTREQFYGGRADWSVIAAVKKAVSIPVIGNGDVTCAADGIRMLEETGCDMVMVGRAALGNPWIFRELTAAGGGEPVPPRPTLEEKRAVMCRHLQDMLALKGEYAAVREMRKHVGWYIKGVPGAAALRARINGITDAAELEAAIRAL